MLIKFFIDCMFCGWLIVSCIVLLKFWILNEIWLKLSLCRCINMLLVKEWGLILILCLVLLVKLKCCLINVIKWFICFVDKNVGVLFFKCSCLML